ncbi:MAG TPA: DUF427 domain-containing protein [Caulobacteraceae bacterium]|nr:DUF427 domain-containing protein [Caulobacteraceae bacterium]
MTSAPHTVRIKANLNRVRATFGGRLIADTRRALTVLETDCRPVLYFPRADVEMGCLTRTDHRTSCPYKGEASYFTVAVDGQAVDNAVWSYEAPIPAVLALKGYLAFYADKVEVHEVTGGEESIEPHAVHP